MVGFGPSNWYRCAVIGLRVPVGLRDDGRRANAGEVDRGPAVVVAAVVAGVEAAGRAHVVGDELLPHRADGKGER